MWADILSRKTHQPMLQLLLQGIAGVGKSEVSRLIAGYFGIPYISIDTASFTSHHEASSMILGSGRGIVQSYLPGKLELAANNHNGCLVEVSDLDHCHPGTRSFFADLFLHILENGYAQSGSGELISCTNLLIIFTINLPGGRDEQALRSLGFNNTPDLQSIKKNIRKEIKNLFSAAFLSRLGNPILFFPIREDALPALLEMALKNSLRTSFLNLGAPSCDISIVPGTAEALLSANYQPEASSGARGVYELARNLVTQEVSKMLGPLRTRGITQSVISMGSDKTLNITLK
jgi:ATP-dependent Clp protease ATP-binding subunit ClpA